MWLWCKYAKCVEGSQVTKKGFSSQQCRVHSEVKHCMVKICLAEICAFFPLHVYVTPVLELRRNIPCMAIGQAQMCVILVLVLETSGVKLRQRLLLCAWPRKVKIVLRWVTLTCGWGLNWPTSFSLHFDCSICEPMEEERFPKVLFEILGYLDATDT